MMRRSHVPPNGATCNRSEENGILHADGWSPNGTDAGSGSGISSTDDPDSKSRRRSCLKPRKGGRISAKQVRLFALPVVMIAPLLLVRHHTGGGAVLTSSGATASRLVNEPRRDAMRESSRNGKDGYFRQFLPKRRRIAVVRPSLDYVSNPRGAGRKNEGGRLQRRKGLEDEAVMQTKAQKKALLDSEDYDHKARDPLYEGDCEPMQPWQEMLFPSCNKIHEIGIADAVSDYVLGKKNKKAATFSYIAGGGYNDIFMAHVDPPVDEEIVLKSLQYGTKFTDRNMDRVRRDVLISERLTRSKFVVDVFGHCGLTQLAPLGKGGTMDDVIDYDFDHLDSESKLKLSLQAAFGLSDAHNIDGDGVSSISQGDLKTDQYLMVDGFFKLGDFNRGRFIRRNRKTNEPCPYTIGHNDAKYRSPEEYRYDPETSKIDVWALGSIFFQILTGQGVWHGVAEKKAQKRIKTGESPPLPEEWKESNDPIVVLLRKVMYEMCFVADPTKRSTAVEVAEFLKAESKKLGYDFEFD